MSVKRIVVDGVVIQAKTLYPLLVFLRGETYRSRRIGVGSQRIGQANTGLAGGANHQ